MDGGKVTSTTKAIKSILDVGNWKSVFTSHGVQSAVIDTETVGSVLLLHHADWGGPGRVRWLDNPSTEHLI